jgi:hypothetical protein
MSLGRPDLYIGGQLMQALKGDPQPALAGLRLRWGTDSRLELDPAATLSGQILIRGAMPSFLEVGAPVGLIDPVTARCLFAGNLAPLTAAPEDSVRGAMRVSFTAASPLSELVKHSVLDFDWPNDEQAWQRFDRLAAALPRGWAMTGNKGLTWINQARQLYQSIEWLTLAERFARGYSYRYHDTSTYIPGAGLSKRLTFTPERGKGTTNTATSPGAGGVWYTGTGRPTGSSGMAILPESAVRRSVEWQKSPEDTITDVKITSYPALPSGDESAPFDYPMWAYGVNNDALQDAYGFRQVSIDTSLSSYNGTALAERIPQIVNYWLDTQTGWRPTGLQLPDSRRLGTDPLLNLLAVDTRGMAALSVPTATLAPGRIRSFVMAGEATWTGKKWTTDLTLGRTL